MTTPEISVDVVVLAWGRIPDTCLAIDSALAQTGVAVRVLVVDQGSEPKDLAVLKAHVEGNPRVTLVCNMENRGVPGGRNQGTALGSAPYVVALDNDAEFASETELARAVEFMEAEPSIAALAFRIILFSTGDDDKSSWPYPISMQENSTRSFETARFVGAGHMLRRSTFDEVGAYDDTLFFLHEEVDLSYRLINHGSRIVYEPSIRVRHKVGQENRVAWNGNRYYFHVRNTVYMAAKYNFPVASGLLQVFSAVSNGIGAGFHAATLRGVLGGLGLSPKALNSRFFNPHVRLTAEARSRIKATSPTRDMSMLQKLQYRLRPWTRPS